MNLVRYCELRGAIHSSSARPSLLFAPIGLSMGERHRTAKTWSPSSMLRLDVAMHGGL